MTNRVISAFSIALLLTLFLVVPVSADIGWDPNSFTGPAWLNPGYEFTFDVSGFTGGTKDICVIYTMNGAEEQENHCTCSSPDCAADIGIWHCLIPSNIDNAAIVWDISGWTGGSCNGSKSLIQAGTFNTGPTAIELSSFDLNSRSKNELPYTSILTISVILLAFLGVMLWRLKS
jgi:hypothetical protein